MRYVYVKNGNAVDQVRRLAHADDLDRSGPDAFVGDFIQAQRGEDLLLLCRTSRRERYIEGELRAEAFPDGDGRLFGVFARGWSAMTIGFQILHWRPQRILCGCAGELLWICVLVSKLLGVPLVHSRHNEVQRRAGFGRILTALDRMSIRACAGVVCHGPFLRDQILALGVPAATVFEFDVDLRGFAAMGIQAVAPLEVQHFARRFKHILMFVGRVQVNKGVIDLLEAFCRLPRDLCERVGLVYIGDGKDMPLLNRRVQGLSIADRVLIVGRVPHSQLAGSLRLASVVVAPTRPEFPEGRCMVVLESLALGVPVIGPDSGPFPYAIRHDVNGLLFEAGKPDGLCAALTRLLEHAMTVESLRRGALLSASQFTAVHQSFAAAVDLAFKAAGR